jgi:hypothetical protein
MDMHLRDLDNRLKNAGREIIGRWQSNVNPDSAVTSDK